MDFAQCHGDSAFGPSVDGCRGNFDFTLKFERIFLSIVPASAFIALALARIGFLIRRSAVVDNLTWMSLKLVGAITYVAVRLALLVLSSKLYHPRGLWIGSTSLEFICSLCILALSLAEHFRSVRPSILLQLYLSLTLLFDITQTRTLWLASTTASETTFSRLFTTAVVVKALLIISESQQKTKWVRWDAEKHSPEETIGFFGMSAYTWLNSTFYNGYTKILFIKDLSPLDQRMASEHLQMKLLHHMSTLKSKHQGFGLVKALAKTLATSIMLPIPARVALTAFKFCQPFLINTLLDYLQKPANTAPKNFGYGLIGASILIYSGLAVSTAIYWYFHERTLCMARSALAGAVYRKTTEVKLSAAGDAAALTLMSTDVERIRLGFRNLHEFWANTIEVALASWLLQRQVGNAFVAPLVVVLVCITGAAFVNRFTPRRQKAWMDKIQKRVGLTATVISSMKHLKISGLAAPVERLIQSMRVDELETASRFRTVYIIVTTIGYAPMALCPVITFAVTAKTLDVSTIFTSLSFLLLLADPLTYLFQNAPNLLAALACLDRIQDFLESDARLDCRIQNIDISSANSSNERIASEKAASGPLIKITNGSFEWETGKATLKNLNLDIPRSQLTILVGPVACGKSTLCKVILGEVSISHGEIILNAGHAQKIGYCDQTPYLSNTSIKENIIGYSAFNASRYNEVIEAAMLLPDLAVLPEGDRTKVGSSGITLSGGQKQRVSLARALYLETDFFVFDDILSGLDADTEDQVFSGVFGVNGILRRRNATAVLSTHSIQHLPSANHIIALGEDGTVVEQGTFQDLIANEKYVHSLDIKESNYASSETQLPTKIQDAYVVRAAAAQTVAPTYLEEKDRMLGDSTVYRYYLTSLGKTSITAFITFGLGWGFFYNFGTVWLRFWSSDVSSPHPSHQNSFYIGIYALFQLSYLLCLFFSFLICFRTMIEVSGSKLHKAALATVINAPLSFFTKTDAGLVTNFFSQDMTLVDNELPIAVTNLACDVANALGMAAVIASSSAYLVISYPFIFVLFYGIQKFYLRTSRQLRLLDLEAKSPLYTQFLDTIRGVATFRAFGWVQPAIEVNNQLLDNSQRPAYLLAMVQRWLGFALQVIVAILAVVVVTLATQLNSSTGLTGASLITLMTFGNILNYIIRWYTQIETSIGAVSRLKNFSQKVMSECLESEDLVPEREWPERGEIVISGVSASYSEIDDSEEGSSPSNLALKDLNITIQPGEKVAICGRSGSGKSSLILLLLSLLSPLPSYSTNITIDSLPLHKISRPVLRERIIAIPQDPVFLPDGSSFMENLDPFNCSTEEECQDVLEAVGLWVMVKERGGLRGVLETGSLSGGTRQLFSLARAVLRGRVRGRELAGKYGGDGVEGEKEIDGEKENEKEKRNVNDVVETRGGILLLDEVSSSVDQDTDRLMQKVIMREFATYTVVMVSHRLEMVMGFDRVLVMDKGSVVESGKPTELIEKEGVGWFRDLCMVGRG